MKGALDIRPDPFEPDSMTSLSWAGGGLGCQEFPRKGLVKKR